MNKKIIYNLKDVCKTYITKEQSVHAVRNLNCQIYEKDFTVIMGSSGSGKSTLLYLVSGMDSVSSGEIHFKDKSLHLMKEKELLHMRQKEIGMIYQGVHLIPYLSILENVAVAAKLITKNHMEATNKAKKLLESLNLKDEFHRVPAQVSGGQQQRAAVARALINDCEVLFADEPTGALNTAQGQNLLDILTEINQKGRTVVMVTHDLKAALRANRILFIRDGKIEGDLNLPAYNSTEPIDEREQTVYNFLRQRGW
jgi:putative ABC transport system ATP-binding protein